MKMTCGEVHMREQVKKRLGQTVTIGRTAITTKNHNGRAACHYCETCERGCITYSYFSSPFTTVKDALKTGRCTLITNAVVAQVDTDPAIGKATGVTFVDACHPEDEASSSEIGDSVRPGPGVNTYSV